MRIPNKNFYFFIFQNFLCEKEVGLLPTSHPTCKRGVAVIPPIKSIKQLKSKIMALEFKVYERADNTLTSLGTVMKAVGKDGFLKLIPKNFKDLTKRVVIVLEKKDGTSTPVSCSKQVSEGLRDKTITLGNVLGFDIMEGEAGVPFITMPSTGEAVQGIAVAKLKPQAYTPVSTVNYEELIAL